VTGSEVRAKRIISGSEIDTIPEFDYAICAVGTRARANPGSAEVAFSCAHGYGLINVPETVWRRHDARTQREVQKAVADDHARRGVVSDIVEHWKVVTL